MTRAKSLLRYVAGPFGAAVSKVGGNALAASSSELGWSLVMSEEGEGIFAVLRSKARSKAGNTDKRASSLR